MTTPPNEPGPPEPGPSGADPQSPYGGAPHDPYGNAPQNPYGVGGPYGGAPQNPYGGGPQGPYGGGPYGGAPQGPYGGGPYGAPGPQPFSVGTAISWGWSRFTANPWPFVLMVLLTLVASIVVGLPFRIAETNDVGSGSGAFSWQESVGTGLSLLGVLSQVLSTLVGLVLSAALVQGALDTTRGERVSFGSMFDGLPWGQVLIAGVLVSIASAIGIALCILPGLVVLFLTMWVNYFIVGHRQDAITAIRSSFALATSRVGDSLITWIVTGLVALVGFCLCGIGALVTVPLSVLALAWSFRTLVGEPVAS